MSISSPLNTCRPHRRWNDRRHRFLRRHTCAGRHHGTAAHGRSGAVVGPNSGQARSSTSSPASAAAAGDSAHLRQRAGGSHLRGLRAQRSRMDMRFPVTVHDVVMMGKRGQDEALPLARQGDLQAGRCGAGASRHDVLGQTADRPALSGGQQQRVFLARALAQEAELLLLDEPLTGLDMPSQQAILTILDDLRGQGITTLVATHDLNEAAEQFPLMWLLNRRMIAQGTPAEVLTPEHLALAYGSQIHVAHGADGELYFTDTCCDGGRPPVADVLRGEHAPAVLAPEELR
ncbi:MAG: ATP-binding cassette domain-containing protein [Caldilineaceae bacterium]